MFFICIFFFIFSNLLGLDIYQDAVLVESLPSGHCMYVQSSRNQNIADFIDSQLIAYNTAKVGPAHWREFSLCIENEMGQVVAGINGSVGQGGWSGDGCEITIWIDPEYRKEYFENAVFYEIIKYAQNQYVYTITVEMNINCMEYSYTRALLERQGFTVSGYVHHTNYIEMIKEVVHEPVEQQDRFVGDDYIVQLDSVFNDYINEQCKDIIVKHDYHEDEYAIYITSGSGDLLGGAVGFIHTDSQGKKYCKIVDVWIHDSLRGKGLGSKIIEQVTQYAKTKNCKYIVLYTMEFQARPFYEKQGFKVVTTFARTKSPHSYECYVLEKQLSSL